MAIALMETIIKRLGNGLDEKDVSRQIVGTVIETRDDLISKTAEIALETAQKRGHFARQKTIA